jgi:DNA-binding transcriptional MerR regulator
LFTLFGAERRANTFCLSIDRGSSNFENICKLGTDPTVSRLMDIRWSKYAGISLNRMRDLGTVEFRMFSPLTHKADYMRVLKFLFAMKQEAMSMESIQEIITYKKANSLSDLFARIFPDEAYSEGFEEDIENGIQLANDIIMSIELEQVITERTAGLQLQLRDIQSTIHNLNGGI